LRPLVFLGGGRISSALIAGLRLSRYPGRIVVHDRNPEKLKALREKYRATAEPDLSRAVQQAGLLIIAVRPDCVGGLLREIGPLQSSVPAVSLAAGVPLKNLRRWLGSPVRWARAMPSPVCRAGKGLTALAFDSGFPRQSLRETRKLFARVGAVLELPENKFDAFTVTYSSSHGYHALAALARAAQKIGLDRETAFLAAAHALADGINAFREGSVPLNELLREAATPGGISAAVMAAMDASGYPDIIERGLRAGVARARSNSSPGRN